MFFAAGPQTNNKKQFTFSVRISNNSTCATKYARWVSCESHLARLFLSLCDFGSVRWLRAKLRFLRASSKVHPPNFLFPAFPLKLRCHYITGPRNKCVPLDTMLIFVFHFGLAGKNPSLSPQNMRRSRPPSAAGFFGCYSEFCADVSLQVHDET